MKDKNIKTIQNITMILNNQKLSNISRVGSMICLGFGELVNNKAAYKTEEGNFEIKHRLTSMYALHIDCGFRMTTENEILLTRGDIFNHNSTINDDFECDDEDFDWDVFGNNSFDEKIKEQFTDKNLCIVVESINISKFGDLKILLSNGYCIEIFVDSSSDEECWRFFEVGNADKKHLVVTGNGFYEV